MRGNSFRDGGNVFTNNTFHAKTEHKSTVSPRLLQAALRVCSAAVAQVYRTHPLAPLNPPSILSSPPPSSVSSAASYPFPFLYDLRPEPFIVYGFASFILCYTSHRRLIRHVALYFLHWPHRRSYHALRSTVISGNSKGLFGKLNGGPLFGWNISRCSCMIRCPLSSSCCSRHLHNMRDYHQL